MKNAFFGENLDHIPYQILKQILGESIYDEYRDIIEFITIEGDIERDILYLYLKPFNSNKILYATYDLKNKKILNSLSKSEILKIFDDEKDKIQELQKKEIERSAKIILTIISLVLGMAVAYFVSKFVFGF
jgi:Mg/Co/Ni transporter MgtE